MPSLQIRDIPPHLLEALKEEAQKERRTLTQQAIVTLERGLASSDFKLHKRKDFLASIGEFQQQFEPWKAVDVVSFIREDRDA